jgi:serine/threonine-protein kinase
LVCDRFESAWRAGPRPVLEEYWSDCTASEAPGLLRDLLAVELPYRVRLGERPLVAEYLSRFPAHSDTVRRSFEIAGLPGTSAAPPSNAERNLLFGVLALQMDFISREALIAAVSAWSTDKSRALDEILVQQGALGAEERALLEPLIRKHLERHGGDPERSLAAAVARHDTARDTLAHVADPDVQASLLRSGNGADPGPMTLLPSGRPVAASHDATAGSARRRFQILRRLAKGGLGEVFVARDEEVPREVALKVIQSPFADDPDSRGRFQREAEVTGRLEHPGVIPVYGLGLDEHGRPFYAMRFIRGEALSDAIARFHAPDGPGADPARRALELRGLLGRFIAVCHAIAYAHSRGVIHRDVKPANVMLGPYGETLVVDWGLAKVAGTPDPAHAPDGSSLQPPADSSATRDGTWIGTPAYMSPEQAEGKVDRIGPASDLYSLGATLYCILTGKAPFGGPNIFATLERVRRNDFAPARSVDRRIPRALEAVSARAMAHRPEDRYPSATDLAGEIERWLADEPVTAFREPMIGRFVRFCRRHRPAVAALGALVTSAALALGVSTLLIGREAARKEQQRQRAEANFVLARDAVDRMLTEVAEVDLADVPQMQSVRKTLLERAQRFYQTFLEQKQSDPALRFEADRAEIRLGRIAELLGDYAQAEQAYGRGIAGLSARLERGPQDRVVRRELAAGQDALGMLFKKANRFRDSERLLRASLATRVELAQALPEGVADRQALAESQYHLGALLARTAGRRAEDENIYREAVRLQQALVTDARDRPEVRRSLARYLNNLGLLLAASGSETEAEAAYREALSILEALVAVGMPMPADRWLLARVRANLAMTLRTSMRRDEAELLYLKARESLESLHSDFPDLPDYRHELASTLNNLGLLRTENKQTAEADRAFRDALAHHEALAKSYPRRPDFVENLAVSRINLAYVLERADIREATRLYDEALALQERLTSTYPEVTEYQLALGRNLYSLARLQLRDDPGGARARLARAVERHRRALDADPQNRIARGYLRDDYSVLCLACLRLNSPEKAADAAEELPRLFPDQGKEHLRAAAFLAHCASSAREGAGEMAAEAFARRSIEVLRRAVDERLVNPADLNQVPELKPLQARPDFQQLLRARTAPAAPRSGSTTRPVKESEAA